MKLPFPPDAPATFRVEKKSGATLIGPTERKQCLMPPFPPSHPAHPTRPPPLKLQPRKVIGCFCLDPLTQTLTKELDFKDQGFRGKKKKRTWEIFVHS